MDIGAVGGDTILFPKLFAKVSRFFGKAFHKSIQLRCLPGAHLKIQALGKGFPALAATVIRVWAVQAPLTYVFAKQGAGQSGPWLAYLASNAVSLGMCAIWTYYQIKKQNRRTV